MTSPSCTADGCSCTAVVSDALGGIEASTEQ